MNVEKCLCCGQTPIFWEDGFWQFDAELPSDSVSERFGGVLGPIHFSLFGFWQTEWTINEFFGIWVSGPPGPLKRLSEGKNAQTYPWGSYLIRIWIDLESFVGGEAQELLFAFKKIRVF